MTQKGFVQLHILIGILLIGLAGIVIYTRQVSITKSPPSTNNQNQATPSASVAASSSPTAKAIPSLLPTKSPTPKPVVTPSVPKSTPTPTPAQASSIKKNTCDVNVFYGKPGGGASDPNLVTLTYSFSGYNNAYMTGAQWDFEGDGNWDTDMKQSNGTIEHTYSSAGTYTVKLRLQGSDGSVIDVCSKSATVPSAPTVPTGVTVRVTGRIYADANCNNFPDPDERGVANAQVRITKLPENYIYTELNTDGAGNFNFSQNIPPDDYLSVSVGNGVVPSGYKANPNFHAPRWALGGSQTSMNLEIPIVPVDNVGACTR